MLELDLCRCVDSSLIREGVETRSEKRRCHFLSSLIICNLYLWTKGRMCHHHFHMSVIFAFKSKDDITIRSTSSLLYGVWVSWLPFQDCSSSLHLIERFTKPQTTPPSISHSLYPTVYLCTTFGTNFYQYMYLYLFVHVYSYQRHTFRARRPCTTDCPVCWAMETHKLKYN